MHMLAWPVGILAVVLALWTSRVYMLSFRVSLTAWHAYRIGRHARAVDRAVTRTLWGLILGGTSMLVAVELFNVVRR